MKVLISYFYQIRFFKPNMIPLSTAMYDPKWFHKTQGKNDIFIDKNGVYNGLKIYPLVPKMYDENTDCSSGKCSNNPPHCQFLSNYRKQLDEINFNEFMEKNSSKL